MKNKKQKAVGTSIPGVLFLCKKEEFLYDGTTAQWEPRLATSDDIGWYYLGSWENIESEMRSSSVVANGFVQILTRTASDRFYITAEEADGCFCLYYLSRNKTLEESIKADGVILVDGETGDEVLDI